ncbi:hypothetical protein TDB9533_01306 [Thalassocella blandensis]|nr:hypothetical protein TDB9533_01306 [Thalassocella blandensis]
MSDNILKFAQYTHTSVRDLAWLLQSEPYFQTRIADFATFSFELNTDAALDYLQFLDQQDTLFFDRHRISRGQYRRLGLYFEALLQFLFTEGWQNGVCPYRLLENNVQIPNKHGKTQGEIDLLLQHSNGTLVHVEAAVKYYLGFANDASWQNWIGPNARDRLDIKMDRLLHHQLPLLRNPASTPFVTRWQNQYQQPHITSQLLLKGMLFQQPGQDSLPEQVQGQIHLGQWCHFSQLNELKRDIVACWPCQKLQWLSGPTIEEANALSLQELIQQLMQAQAPSRNNLDRIANANSGPGSAPYRMMLPLLCYTKDRTEQIEQLMIVPDHWPDSSTPSRKI